MSHTIDVRVRRRPKYAVFMGAGAVIGLITAPLVAAQQVEPLNPAEEYSFAATAAFFSAMLGTIGLFLGGAVALVIERVAARKHRDYTVQAYYQRMGERASGNGEASGTETLDADAEDTEATVSGATGPEAGDPGTGRVQAGAPAAGAEGLPGGHGAPGSAKTHAGDAGAPAPDDEAAASGPLGPANEKREA